MFRITVSKSLFGPSVRGLGKVVKVGGSIATQMTVNGKVLSFFLELDPTELLRSLQRGGKVTHKENGIRYTFSPVYA